nr:ATP synthase F0 subunit 8 [Rasbora argyrotaenia]
MPQLNPIPWFTILLFSWAILLIITPIKVLDNIQPNDPILLEIKKYQDLDWIWLW